jgi:S-(hydroxymethyl)glutathione dehydrogenase/alcohol dehydrogenase
MGMEGSCSNANEGRFDVEDVRIDIPAAGRYWSTSRRASSAIPTFISPEANYGVPLPAVLGHELAGKFAKSTDVRELKVGDHAGSDRSCSSVVRPQAFAGPVARTSASIEEMRRATSDGQRLTRMSDDKPVYTGWGTAAFAEQALVHENQLVKIPELCPSAGLDFGLWCDNGRGSAINSADLKTGDTVVAIGVGGVG